MSQSSPQIFIRGFPKQTKQTDLKALFEKFGNIKQTRIIKVYAFIAYESQDSVKEAIKEMNDYDFQGNKLKVQIAGRPKKRNGPQPKDECRYCHKLGHWKTSCSQYKRRFRKDIYDRRRHRSTSSVSSSSSSDKHQRKKKSRKRSPSSSSNSSSSSSSSSSSKSRVKIKKSRNQRNQRSKKHESKP